MPRFFFDTDDGDTDCSDQEGVDLPDMDAARSEALMVLPEMAREKLPDGDHRVFAVTVRDVDHAVIYVATLSLQAEWRART